MQMFRPFPNWIRNSVKWGPARCALQVIPVHAKVWDPQLGLSFEMNCSPLIAKHFILFFFSWPSCLSDYLWTELSFLSLDKYLRQRFSKPLLYLPTWPIVDSHKSMKLIPFKSCSWTLNICQPPVSGPWRDNRTIHHGILVWRSLQSNWNVKTCIYAMIREKQTKWSECRAASWGAGAKSRRKPARGETAGGLDGGRSRSNGTQAQPKGCQWTEMNKDAFPWMGAARIVY